MTAPGSAQALGDFNWGFGKGLLSLAPPEPPPAVWGRDRNGFPWERTGAPLDRGSEAPRGLLEEREGGGERRSSEFYRDTKISEKSPAVEDSVRLSQRAK